LAADLSRVPEPYLMPEFSERPLEPSTIAAGFQPDDDLAGEPRVEAADIVSHMKRLQVMELPSAASQ
jgi:hypothetical protein